MRFILPRGFGGSDCSIFGSIFVILLFIALKNCTMHKGNGSRVWDISCIKNESGYFID